MQKQRNRIEKKRFRDPSARRHRFGEERGAESSSLFAVSQFVVRSPRRLHCAAGTAALRVYETRHYLPLRPFPGRADAVRGKTLPARRVRHPQKRRTPFLTRKNDQRETIRDA